MSQHLRVRITSAAGEILEEFDLKNDLGWQPHKVASEVRNLIEHLYEDDEDDLVEHLWREEADREEDKS